MTLPSNFQFSQGSLQDYDNCPRRFQLRYIEHLSWPALQVEPARENEYNMHQGASFHRMVHRYLLGVPEKDIANSIKTNQHLNRWWHNFVSDNNIKTLLNSKSITRHPEITLSTPIGQYRLVAKYDLILIEPGQRAIIFDWKTSNHQPKHTWMANKYQTIVYPFVLSQAGTFLNDGKLLIPEQITMIYWYANFPEKPLRYLQSTSQIADYQAKLLAIIDEIQTLSKKVAPLTDNEKLCHYCVYRSLCKRGVKAGLLDEFKNIEESNGNDFDIDFDQIAEILY